MSTLGYHRDMCAAAFGEDSPATKYLDRKISEAPNGRKEEVVESMGQMLRLLSELHKKGHAHVNKGEL